MTNFVTRLLYMCLAVTIIRSNSVNSLDSNNQDDSFFFTFNTTIQMTNSPFLINASGNHKVILNDIKNNNIDFEYKNNKKKKKGIVINKGVSTKKLYTRILPSEKICKYIFTIYLYLLLKLENI